MDETIQFLEERKEFKKANEIKVILQENENLKKEKKFLQDFITFVVSELKQRYSRDKIINNLVVEAKKRKLFL